MLQIYAFPPIFDAMQKIIIGIIKEGKTPPDERVPISPSQAAQIQAEHPQIKVLIQNSDIRRYKNEEYAAHGLELSDDMSSCDILLGVKEVPIDQLIPHKKYFFFSHTIKKQPYNRDLLRALIEKNIQLVDYECLTDAKGRRLIGFGRYAGIVGAYNTLLAYGKKTGLYKLKPAHLCFDQKEMIEELNQFRYDKENPPRILLTGYGRVSHGAMEILDHLGISKIDTASYLLQQFNEPVYCVLRVTDYNKRKDGKSGSIQDFFINPEVYETDFMRFAKVTSIYMACHFWKEGSPFIFSREDARHEDFNIQIVGDISCDIDGPVASTLRPSTIKDPLYGYDRTKEREVAFEENDAIGVMAVDNLPCELPMDASSDFGTEFMNKILPALLGKDPENIIERASITKNGELTEYFSYLTDYLQGMD